MRARGAWRYGIAWLKDRADNVAVALLAAMFVSFILQILFRYVVGEPLTWTLEACLLTWLWLVFWAGGFLLDDRDHVKFDIVYAAAGPRVRRIFAILAALVIVAAFAAALPATLDFIAFMKIESSSSLGLRLDYVFACYLIFCAGVLVRYGLRALRHLRSGEASEPPAADPDRSR